MTDSNHGEAAGAADGSNSRTLLKPACVPCCSEELFPWSQAFSAQLQKRCVSDIGRRVRLFEKRIIGAALFADEVFILTDVDGTSDSRSRLVSGARR